MPRRKAAMKREILPDPLYGSELLAKFINVVMRRGKKSLAEKIVYKAMGFVVEQTKKDKQGSSSSAKKGPRVSDANLVANPEALEALEKALHNIRPTVEVKSRRVGGATYQVPVEVDPVRGVALAMRMLSKAAKARAEKTMVLRLAAEIMDALHGRGAAVKERDDIHRMAKANQAFAHYRW
jgi:small subunit ribosomal protein S7